MQQQYTRRGFSHLMAAGVFAPGSGSTGNGLPVRPLGRIRFEVSIVGLGAQRIADQPMEPSAVDRLIGEALDNGLNYIDTARGYGDSEDKLGRALAGKRHKVFLVTKTRSATREGALRDVQESLRRLRTDYVDCVHIHNIARDDRFPDLNAALSEDGVLGGLLEAKKKGMMRHIGCTAHLRPGRVLPVFATGAIELFMCTINFVERHIYNFEERVLPEAAKRGIAVAAMKVLGGPDRGPQPRLASPEDYRDTLRYVWSLPQVAVAVIGIRNNQELRQALAAARDFQPLAAAEMARIMARGKAKATGWGLLRGPAD